MSKFDNLVGTAAEQTDKQKAISVACTHEVQAILEEYKCKLITCFVDGKAHLQIITKDFKKKK